MDKYSQVRGIPVFRFGYVGASQFVVVVNFYNYNIAVSVIGNKLDEIWWSDTTYDSQFVEVHGKMVRLEPYDSILRDRFFQVQPNDCVRIIRLIQEHKGSFQNPLDLCPTNLKRRWYIARTHLLSTGSFLQFLDVDTSLNKGAMDLVELLGQDCEFFFPSLFDFWETFHLELDLCLPESHAEDWIYELYRLHRYVMEESADLKLRRQNHRCIIPGREKDAIFFVLAMREVTKGLFPEGLDEDCMMMLFLTHSSYVRRKRKKM